MSKIEPADNASADENMIGTYVIEVKEGSAEVSRAPKHGFSQEPDKPS